MEKQYAKNRSSQCSQESQNSQFETRVGSMGYVSGLSSEHGTNEIGISREDSNQPNNSIAPGEQSVDGISGKIVGQLINEVEKQLAYHQKEAEILQERLEELKNFSEEIKET